MSQRLEAPTPLLLAGGRSRRMGRDKRLLPVGGTTLVRRAYDALQEAFGPPQVLVADLVSAEAIADALPPGARFVCDSVQGAGPLGALAGALRASETTYAFLLACDVPAIDSPALRSLWRASQSLTPRPMAYVPSADGFAQVTCALYHRDLAAPLHAATVRGETCLWHGLRALEGVHVAVATDWPPGVTAPMFRNINTARDYEALVAERGTQWC